MNKTANLKNNIQYHSLIMKYLSLQVPELLDKNSQNCNNLCEVSYEIENLFALSNKV